MSGSCDALDRDPSNCGMSGNECPDGQVCSGGVCTCAPGLSMCSSACTDLETDVANCGSCGNACSNGQVCSKGQCAAACATGETSCAGSCIVGASDPNHCGGCDTQCGQSERCLDGNCVEFVPARGCSSCPCDDCTFERGWLCCTDSSGAWCSNSYRCPP